MVGEIEVDNLKGAMDVSSFPSSLRKRRAHTVYSYGLRIKRKWPLLAQSSVGCAPHCQACTMHH